jgi:hypothetical protein
LERPSNLTLSSPGPDRPIEIEGGADKGQVDEGLGKVAQSLAARADVLCVRPQVVGIGEHLLEEKSGLINPPRPRQRLHELERAKAESTLLPHETVCRLLDAVAVHRAVEDELHRKVTSSRPLRVGRDRGFHGRSPGRLRACSP